jgi:hypothetical protein
MIAGSVATLASNTTVPSRLLMLREHEMNKTHRAYRSKNAPA